MPFVDAAGAVPTGAPQNGNSLGGLDSEAFLRLLVAQMRYQDPMAPADHTAMLQQTSQFTQVETLQQVSAMQQQMLGLSQAGMAAEMVGKQVTALGPDGETITGVVEGVRFTSEGPVLDVEGQEVPMQAATEIRLSGAATAAGAFVQGGGVDDWQGPWFHDAADRGDADDTVR
jgi:flagellar basal-body rod modification protein FlgD